MLEHQPDHPHEIIDFNEFRKESFALIYRDNVNHYMNERVRGIPQGKAFISAFGRLQLDANFGARICYLESNPYVVSEMPNRREMMNIEKVWSVQRSVSELLTLVEDESVKPNVKINAIKELNVLAGITTFDQQGNSKRSPQAEARANALIDVLNSARAAITQH